MKQICIAIFFWLNYSAALSQSQDDKKQNPVTDTSVRRPEIFSSGFIDIMNNGQVNASARFLKLFIGEPGKFSVPVSFYGGVSNNNFQSQGTQLIKSNEHLINQYITPLSGLINVSIDGTLYFCSEQKKTKSGWIYQIGERILNGIKTGNVSDPSTGKPVNFLNGFAATGYIFQTGAWEKNDNKNLGIFWAVIRLHLSYSNPKQLREFLPDIRTNGCYTGYSIGFGIEINNLVNIKAIYYKYFKAPEIDYGFPIYQFSFNYTMNR